ncbi:CpaF family protein [Gymnodinialimonas sp. 57CJ19]|uniref:CpaF family protein n=1 Tax=Gymnodinialimonas sp. 57CJ19 TaxID=3138498 RepID=UPI00313445CD
MTLHIEQPSLREALDQVLSLARRIDAAGLSATERANAAITFVVEDSGHPWPMSLQRQILTQAAAILAEDDTADDFTAPAPAKTGLTVPPASPSAAAPKPAAPSFAAPASAPSAAFQGNSEETLARLRMANEITLALSKRMDFAELAVLSRRVQEENIRVAISELSSERKLQLNGTEIADLVGTILSDMLGLGPLEALLADESITDIMVNGPDQVYVERGGKLTLTNVRFRDNAHVLGVATRIVADVGRRIDEAQPMVDARLADGSRVNVAIPPLAIDGPTITIRKFPNRAVKFNALVEGGSLSSQMAGFLGLASLLRLNILISGGTGSGKTTLMNAMSEFIPADERIVTIEDAAELRLQQPHVVRFETRPPSIEGNGEVTTRTLVRNSLRMRPDRIIIGEIRGDEVLDLLQAMNTGHDGSMSTLHANSPREALTRVESMAALAGFAPGGNVVRKQLSDAVHLIVQVSRMRDGRRRITSISEIAGLAGDAITLQEIFHFDVSADSTRDAVQGQFVHTGYRPNFATRAAEYGLGDDLDRILGMH